MLSACMTALVGCSAQKEINQFQKTWDGIFATRPQNRTHFVALYRLKSPALLESVKTENGVSQIDPQKAQELDQEQNDFIIAAQKLSPEIKVVYKYRLVLNAVTLVAPVSAEKDLGSLTGVSQVEISGQFNRPQNMTNQELAAVVADIQQKNSVNYIGADVVHNEGIRGQGLKVGIVDTGIDYTHSMLGGPGTLEAYKSVSPNIPSPLFPNKKVVGGIDLVGTDFDSASANFMRRLPIADPNPMDEAGHGSHVAGTVAGIGDGVKTYSGVAPDAVLYAIKVFGAAGSTSDEVVIAGLEYAADPNGDMDLSDHLDVINMSLGSSYGTPHIFYAVAIKNLSQAGTLVVASAGNSGPKQHIVGAPSVAEEAISVAASVDNSDQNWKFRAVRFVTPSNPEILVEAIESTISKPIEAAGDVTGSLVFVGLANVDFTEAEAAKLKGQVAFIDRGLVPFADKMLRAEKAGAIGVVVANNQEGASMAMGGEGEIHIPAIMISKELGDKLKAEMNVGPVSIQFKTEGKIDKPELIDTLTGFSSQGPRSLDSLIKPEISAPGLNVISAKMGAGFEGTQMSGTSMAGPHIAGVMALLKQSHPTLTSRELKSILMGTSVSIFDEKKQIYPISRQGAGRVQVDRAVHAAVASETVSLSLGEVQLDQAKILEKEMDLKNISTKDLNLTMKIEGSPNLLLSTQSISLPQGQSTHLKLRFKLAAQGLTEAVNEVGGWVKFMDGEQEIHRIPVLAMVRLISVAKAQKLVVSSSSVIDSFESPVELGLINQGSQKADVLLFNSLGLDTRKQDPQADPLRSKACDLQAVGYRLNAGKIEIAAKTFEPMTTWNTCEISVQLDNDNDGIADQELVGTNLDTLDGIGGGLFKSVLLDAKVARSIRKEYEAKVMEGVKDAVLDYTTSVQAVDELTFYPHSTVIIVRMDVSQLRLSPTGEFSLKISTTNTEDYAVAADDYLGKAETAWKKLDSTDKGQAFMGLGEVITVDGHSQKKVEFKKGFGKQDLMVLIPSNNTTAGSLQKDTQLQLLKPSYKLDQVTALN